MKTRQCFRLFALFLSMLWLSGCQLFNQQANYKPPSTAADINQFTARGKLLLSGNGEKVSGYFYWQNNIDRLELSLNTFVGINLFKMVYQDGVATINADGKEYVGDDPQYLIWQLTGQNIPVKQLSKWMLGQTTEGVSDPEFNDKKQLTGFNVRHDSKLWRAKYKSWTPVLNFELPKELDLRATGSRIKLSVSEWQVGR